MLDPIHLYLVGSRRRSYCLNDVSVIASWIPLIGVYDGDFSFVAEEVSELVYSGGNWR
jgi:hypothetical protein